MPVGGDEVAPASWKVIERLPKRPEKGKTQKEYAKGLRTFSAEGEIAHGGGKRIKNFHPQERGFSGKKFQK